MTDPMATPPETLDPSDPVVATVDPTPPVDPSPSPADQAVTPEPKGDWPDDWRQKYSSDPKIIKRLERYASPKAALDALFAAQTKISSGELKSVLKADATPEEMAAWRADNGIPSTPDDYDMTLADGRVVGESDKELVSEFLKTAHESNMHPDQVKTAVGWYLDRQQKEINAIETRDSESRASSEDTLREEYGSDYRRNVMLAKQLLDSAPGGIGEQLMAGRLSDGTPVGNSPEVIRWLVSLSREINPIGTVVPGSGTNAMQAAENELASLRSMMGDHKSEYWKGPDASKKQARYRELTSAMQKGR